MKDKQYPNNTFKSIAIEFLILNFFFLFYYLLMSDLGISSSEPVKIALKKYLLKLSTQLPISIVIFIIINAAYFAYFRKKLLKKLHHKDAQD